MDETLLKRINDCSRKLTRANDRESVVSWMAEADTLLDLFEKAIKKNSSSRNSTLEEAAQICDETYVEPGDLRVESCHEAAEKIRALKRPL